MIIANWLLNNIGWVLLVFLPTLSVILYAKKIDHHEFTWNEVGLTLLVGVVMTVCSVGFSFMAEIRDVNSVNGVIVTKDRVHGSYTTCNSTNKDGVCQSWTTHYTVDWQVIGNFGTLDNPLRINTNVGHYESTSSSSRNNRPDPVYYTQAINGNPMAAPVGFRNYIKGAPFSLFSEEDPVMFADKMPAYPDIIGYYNIDRVINVDTEILAFEVAELDKMLDESLKTIGPFKQANIIVVLTEVDDSTYRYQLERAWLGGKKNDVVVIVGLDGREITWSETFTFARSMGNETLKYSMQRSVPAIGEYDNEALHGAIVAGVNSEFTRISEKQFSYLANDVKPKWWVILLAMMFTFLSSCFIIYKLRTN